MARRLRLGPRLATRLTNVSRARRVASGVLGAVARAAEELASRVAERTAEVRGFLPAAAEPQPQPQPPSQSQSQPQPTRAAGETARPTARAPGVPSVPAASPETHLAPPYQPAPPPPLPPAPPLSWVLVEHLGVRLNPRLDTLRAADPELDEGARLRLVRVASRRLRAFVALFEPELAPRKLQRTRKGLRVVTRAIGPVRELDAHVGLLSANDAASELDRAATEHLLAHLAGAREEAIAAARRTLERSQSPALADDLARRLDTLCGRTLRSGADPTPWIAPLAVARVRALAARLPPSPMALLADRANLDEEALHEVRIVAKQLRYTLELVRPLTGRQDRATRRVAKKIQRALGRFRDHALLHALVREHAETLEAAGHRVLAGALRRRADAFAAEQAAALDDAERWLPAFTPARIVGLVEEALGVTPPAEPSPSSGPGLTGSST